ncbi:LIM domain-containing protein 1 isoform X2 [Oreochromis aureus]|uniref:LIM domain-containing protein 1 isoform X2 n=1 Tax=Oreochromis aureus TaxID=47969 RepID=UPI001954F5DD|nr:LIM domain-containing protein 1 isoform X2 [Oreochromis aureus]
MNPSYSESVYFGTCTRCNQGVYGAGQACQALGRLFHSACFICSVCSKTLSGKPFYTVSGMIYCEDDFLFSGVHPSPEVCNSCGFLITDVTEPRGSAFRRRLTPQDLLCQRLPQGPGSPLCCLQAADTPNRRIHRVYSSDIL